MGKVTCPNCSRSIDAKAMQCECGLAFTVEDIAARSSGWPKKVGIGCLGLFGLFIGLGVISDMIDPDGAKQAESAKLAVADQKAEDAKRREDQKAAAIGLYQGLLGAVAECDAATGKLATALKGGDQIDAYRQADASESACLGTSTKIHALSELSEGFDEKRKADAEKAIETCAGTYVMKWSGARSLKTVLDGDSRPSVIAEMQDTAKTVQTGQFLCSAQMLGVAQSYGATFKELGIDDKESK